MNQSPYESALLSSKHLQRARSGLLVELKGSLSRSVQVDASACFRLSHGVSGVVVRSTVTRRERRRRLPLVTITSSN